MTGYQPHEPLTALALDQAQVLDLTRAVQNAMATRDSHAFILSSRGYSPSALAKAMGMTRSAVLTILQRADPDKVG